MPQIKKALLTEENCTNFINLLTANNISLIGETIEELKKNNNELITLLHHSKLNPNLKQRLQSAISNFIERKITNRGINLLSDKDLELASFYSSQKRRIDTIPETERPNKKLKLAQDKVNFLEELDRLNFYPVDDLRQINQKTNGEEILKILFELHNELIKKLTKNQIIQIALISNTDGALFKNNCTNFIKLTELNKQVIYDDHILIKILIYNTTDLIITNYPKIQALNLNINEIADITCFVQNGSLNLQVFLEKYEPLLRFGLEKSLIISSARNYNGNYILLKIETILNTLSAAGFTIDQFKKIFIIPDFLNILEEIEKLYTSHQDWTFEPAEIMEIIYVTYEFDHEAFVQKKINSLTTLKTSNVSNDSGSQSENLIIINGNENLNPSNKGGFFSNSYTIPINPVTSTYFDSVQKALNNKNACDSFKQELVSQSIPYNLNQVECNQFLVKIPELLANSSLDNESLITLCLSWLNNLSGNLNAAIQRDIFWQTYRNTLYNHLWEFTHIVIPIRVLHTQFTTLRNQDETPAVPVIRENYFNNMIYMLRTAQFAVSKYPHFKTSLINHCINWSYLISNQMMHSGSPESHIFANKVKEGLEFMITDLKYISNYVDVFYPNTNNSPKRTTKLSGPDTNSIIDLTTSNPASPLPVNDNNNEPTSRSSTSPYPFFNTSPFTPNALFSINSLMDELLPTPTSF